MSDELPWPQRGSSIYTIIGNGHFSACLGWARGKRYGYEEGYRRAANILFEHIMETGTSLDSVVFPLAYLWRHALELQLKRIIVDGALLREVETNVPMHHKLVGLWKLAKIEIVALDDVEPEGTETVEHILGELDALDPETTGFRFHEDRHGNPNLRDVPERLDLPNFHEVLGSVHTFLACGNMEISQRLEHKAEMEAAYRF